MQKEIEQKFNCSYPKLGHKNNSSGLEQYY